MNTKILASLVLIGIAISGITMGTVAYFSDVEKSTGNTFTAGKIDLKVDNDCYYNGQHLTECFWEQTDLTTQKFFNLVDIKPGDYGEDTVSLHVYDNDAWGRLVIDNLINNDVSCNEPECVAESGTACESPTGKCGTDPGAGELRQNLRFWVWLDEGVTPGFQGKSDLGEGDNIQQAYEPILITEGPIDAIGETWYLAPGLLAAYNLHTCSGVILPVCKGLTSDGHMVGSVTYYFGIGWTLPTTVGNEAQSDVFGADMSFEVVQYRHVASPGWS